jgi:hypothetical protein
VFSRASLDEMIARAGLTVFWERVSAASDVWVAPDDPTPLESFTLLLRKRSEPQNLRV